MDCNGSGRAAAGYYDLAKLDAARQRSRCAEEGARKSMGGGVDCLLLRRLAHADVAIAAAARLSWRMVSLSDHWRGHAGAILRQLSCAISGAQSFGTAQSRQRQHGLACCFHDSSLRRLFGFPCHRQFRHNFQAIGAGIRCASSGIWLDAAGSRGRDLGSGHTDDAFEERSAANEQE